MARIFRLLDGFPSQCVKDSVPIAQILERFGFADEGDVGTNLVDN